jgi:hypothetical protein
MAIPIIDGVLAAVNTIGGLFGNWQKRKMVKAEGQVEIEKALVAGEIKRIQTGVEQEGSYNVEAQKGMAGSWKDEIFVIAWLAILIAAFVPYTQAYVQNGFLFLEAHTPWWYSYCLVGMVVASFGLKGWKLLKP